MATPPWSNKDYLLSEMKSKVRGEHQVQRGVLDAAVEVCAIVQH